MISFSTFVIVILAIASFASCEDALLETIKGDILIQCAKDLKVDLKTKNIDSTPEYNCLFKCVFEKEGLLKNGVFMEEELMKHIKADPELDAAEKGKITKVLPKCLIDAKSTTDPCVKSFNFTLCVYKGFI